MVLEVADVRDEAEFKDSSNRTLVFDNPSEVSKMLDVQIGARFARLRVEPTLVMADHVNVRATIFFKGR